MKLHTYGLNKDLIFEYKKAFVSDNDRKIMNFLRLYFNSLEDENGPMYNVFVLQNPIELAQKYNEMEYELKKRCLAFIVSNLKVKHYEHELKTFLGIIHEKGLFGKERNTKKAFAYYSSASQNNIPLATYKMARCYELGIGCKKDFTRALNFYRCAAKLGLIDAIHAYGSLIIKSDTMGLEDISTGLFYLNLAAKNATKHYPFACYDLGRFYEKGILEFRPDLAYAFTLYRKGASLGCPNCQYRLAIAHEKGELNCNVDLQEMVQWTREASYSDHTEAQYSLAKLYYFGVPDSLAKNHKMAYLWALKSAAKEHPNAIFLVSEFLERGVGTDKDTLAAQWWKRILKTLFGRLESYGDIFQNRS